MNILTQRIKEAYCSIFTSINKVTKNFICVCANPHVINQIKYLFTDDDLFRLRISQFVSIDQIGVKLNLKNQKIVAITYSADIFTVDYFLTKRGILDCDFFVLDEPTDKKTIDRKNITYLPIPKIAIMDSNIVILDKIENFYDVYSSPGNNTKQIVSCIAQKLMEIIGSLNIKPDLMCYENDISMLITINLKNLLDCCRLVGNDDSVQFLILDRSYDFVTPLTHSETYYAMVNTLFGDFNTLYKTFSKEEFTDSEKKKICDIWGNIKYLSVQDVKTYLSQTSKEAISAHKTTTNLNEKNPIKTLLDGKQTADVITAQTIHVDIFNLIDTIVQKTSLYEQIEIEQTILSGKNYEGELVGWPIIYSILKEHMGDVSHFDQNIIVQLLLCKYQKYIEKINKLIKRNSVTDVTNYTNGMHSIAKYHGSKNMMDSFSIEKKSWMRIERNVPHLEKIIDDMNENKSQLVKIKYDDTATSIKSTTRNLQKKTVVICLFGGATLQEIQVVTELAKKKQINIIVITDFILNPMEYLNKLNSIGNIDSTGKIDSISKIGSTGTSNSVRKIKVH